LGRFLEGFGLRRKHFAKFTFVTDMPKGAYI